jgi:hypothetical protein
MGIDCLRQWSLRSQGDKGAYDAVEGRVYEAYEVKNKRQKLRCLLLRRKKKNIFYLFMKSLLWKKFLNGALNTTLQVF